MTGTPQDVNRWVNDRLLAAYSTAERARGIAAGTLRVRLSYLRRMMAGDSVEGFLATASWSPAARRSAVSALRSYLRWAVRHQVPGAPAPDLFDLPRPPRGQPRPAPDAAISAAVLTADPTTRLMLLLACEAGLRRSEVASLHSRDLVAGELVVRGKGGHERRVPCPPDIADDIAAADGWVFPSPRRPGEHLTADNVGRRMSAALGPGWTGHQLRHRFATVVQAQRGDLLTLQKLLGHASVATTMVYAQVADTAMRAAVAAARLTR